MGRSFLADKDPLCDDFHIKRAKWRVKIGKVVGEFTKKFMATQNDGFETYFSRIPRRASKRAARKAIFQFNKDERAKWQAQRRPRPQLPHQSGSLQQQPLPATEQQAEQQPAEQPRVITTASAPTTTGAAAATEAATEIEAGSEAASQEILR